MLKLKDSLVFFIYLPVVVFLLFMAINPIDYIYIYWLIYKSLKKPSTM